MYGAWYQNCKIGTFIIVCILLNPRFFFAQDPSDPPTVPLDSLSNLKKISEEFLYDIKYASSDNFLHQKVYTCDACYIRPEVALALVAANNYFCEYNLQILLYDCYRPLDVQYLMWSIYPNPSYVANPNTTGSIHTRGAAVDLTLVNKDTREPLDMGTPYDYFGKEAHIDNMTLSREVQFHRKLLREGMRKFGFHPIRTEWWHFSYKQNYSYPILNVPFECNTD